SADEVARQRGTQPAALSKSLRGDLDWIVLKALAKDRARRYPTPDDLAADIGRYLRSEPISARPPSLAYQFRKFARRNRWVVTGVAGFLFVLIAGVVVSTMMYLRAEESRGEATAVAQFLGGMLAGANPQGGKKDITVREVLDRASMSVGDRFHGEPLV